MIRLSGVSETQNSGLEISPGGLDLVGARSIFGCLASIEFRVRDDWAQVPFRDRPCSEVPRPNRLARLLRLPRIVV